MGRGGRPHCSNDEVRFWLVLVSVPGTLGHGKGKNMQLNSEICERARLTRDARFDGRFFIGVKTTGIYCRPVCPVKMPKACNVVFLVSAAAASEAGFRPCLRCRPECAPGSPAWYGSSSTVRRGLRLIASGALDCGNVTQLATRLGVTDRHLRRLFKQHLGASPTAVAHTGRLHFAKRLLDETSLTMTQVALAAGYGSVRRFNDQFSNTYGRTPSELRKQSQSTSRRNKANLGKGRSGMSLRLSYRKPFDWNAMLQFLTVRATPGVEEVVGQRYARTITVDNGPGMIEVQPAKSPGFFALTIHAVATDHLFEVTQTAREALDLDAPVAEIAKFLGQDKKLATSVRWHPGIRVPGAWNGFELTVRAILGQQISVKAATTLAGRLAGRYGQPIDVRQMMPGSSSSLGGTAGSTLSRVFPTPARLAKARFTNLGITQSRVESIRQLAAATERGEIDFDPTQEPKHFCQKLQAIRGIGEWTAQYVAMRVLKDPDAFVASDLGLLKAIESGKKATPKELAKRAERWRPWRAYAAMHLWHSLTISGK